MERQLEVIDMPGEDGSELHIKLYTWKLVRSKDDKQSVVQQLKTPTCTAKQLVIVLQSTQSFLVKEEAVQDAMEKQTTSTSDCTHLVLNSHKVEAPSMFDILSYLVAEELRAVVYNMRGPGDYLKRAWEELDNNTPDNLFCWMQAVMSRIPLADSPQQLYLTDVGLPLNIYTYIVYSYMGMKEMASIMNTSVPDYLCSLIQEERNRLHLSGQWLHFQ